MTHNNDIGKIESLIDKLGKARFQAALAEIIRREYRQRQATCDHKWTLSQIAGDGYTCHKCNAWKPEDD